MLASMPLVLPLLILRQIQRKDGRQDKQVVLTWSNVHAIRLGERDPRLGDGGHHLIPPPDRVVVLEYAPRHMQFFRAGNVNAVAIDEGTKDFLPYRSNFLPVPRDMIRRTQCDQLLLDRRQFIAESHTACKTSFLL